MNINLGNVAYSRFVFIVLLLFSAPALSEVYACVGSDGKSKYQDLPCKEQEKSTVVQTKNPDLGVSLHTVEVPNLGKVILAKFKNWQVTTLTPKDSKLQIIRIEYPNPRDPLSVSINITARAGTDKKPPQQTLDTVEQMARPYIATSVEQAANIKIYKADLGTLIYATFTDKSLQNVSLGPGDFKKMTVGMMHHSRVTISYSILSNSTDMRAFKNLLLVFKHLIITV